MSFVLYRKTANKKIEIESHPILDLVNHKVNNSMTSQDFFELWATYLALQGQFFAVMNSSKFPTEINYLYPHYTKPIPDKFDIVSGFEYCIDGKKYIYDKDFVLWSKFNDALDFYQGMSPVRAMARTIDTENESVDWNKSTLQNSAVPPGAIQVVNPSPQLREKLREDWLKRYGGSANARIPLVLDSEKASYVSFGLNPIDMDFINQRKLSRIEICAGFGVPSQVVGDPEGQTYSNYSEAIKSFWEDTILPRYVNKIVQTLNLYLVSSYDKNLRLEANLDNIQALHESVDSISKRTTALFKDGVITRNEARSALGYQDDENGNVYINDLNPLQMQQLQQQDNENDDKKLIGKLERKKKLDVETKKQLWTQFEKDREKFYKQGENLFKTLFEDELEKIQKLRYTKNNMYNKIEQVINSNIDEYDDKLTNFYFDVMRFFGDKTEKEINSKKNVKSDAIEKKFNLFDENLLSWIYKFVGEKISMITDTTKKDIKTIIEKSQNAGDTIQQIAKNIDRLYLEQIIPNRSTIIARTETIASSNFASLESARQLDLGLKKIWLPTADEKTRDTHKAMFNYPAIRIDELFQVGGSLMQAPGDPSGSASEVIQCRCAITYADEGNSDE